MPNTEKNWEDILSTSNIFDDFEVDEETKNDINHLKDTDNKDMYYYLNKAWLVFKIINYVFFVLIILLGSYIFLQKSTSDFARDQWYLNSFCNILIWSEHSFDNCSSLAVSLDKINNKIDALDKLHLKKIIPILEKTYEINNIKNSKESLFIIDKNNNNF